MTEPLKPPSPKHVRRLALTALLSLGVLAALGAGAVFVMGNRRSTPSYSLGQIREASAKLSVETLQRRGPNIIWFGHSLLQVGGAHPIHIPNTLRAIHEEARKSGRTSIPLGQFRVHYEGPNDLAYWFDGPGAAPEKLRSEDPGWDYAVGIGFMHLVGPGRANRALFNLLGSLAGYERFKTYSTYTTAKYRAIRALRDYNPKAVWINYVGPRHSNHPEEQPFVDERFECIRETAQAAGGQVLNVPVGRAFRAAEAAGSKTPELGVELQLPDRLHLTKQGEYLAANVFFRFFYGVDPEGIDIPEAVRGKLAPAGVNETAIARLLQRVARETVDAHEAGNRVSCSPEARLPEDDAGAAYLSGG